MAKSLPDGKSLSLQEQIAQMIVVRASGYLFDHQIRYPHWEPPAATLQHWLQDLNLGGVILLGGSAGEIALRSQQLQAWAKTPLLIAADIEEGVGQRFAGATWFPPPMAIGEIAKQDASLAQSYAQKMGAVTAAEALAVGINWIFAPVVDVNNNPANPVINVRSFGETVATVTQLATAFIQGAQAFPVLTTAKHFPGHGDTAVDSHLDLPALNVPASRLAAVELPPFENAIAAGVDSVMSAHLLVPAWDSQFPATLSQPILTGELRQRLGFEGLIVTDALIMGALATSAPAEEIPILAVEAGADILLMPDNPEKALSALLQAVETGRITPERIRASVERIWEAKRRVIASTGAGEAGEAREETFNLQPATCNLSQLAPPTARTTAAEIVREAMQVGGSPPLPTDSPSGSRRNLIVVDNPLDCEYIHRHAPAVALPKQLGYEPQLLDQQTLLLVPNNTFQSTLLQLFIRGNPFRGSAGLTPKVQDWLQARLTAGELQGVVIYGSPYVWEWLQPQIPPQLPFLFSYGQMPMAQAIACRVLFGLSGFADSQSEAFL